MTFVRRLTLALFVFGMRVASAHAAPISLNYDFTASGFRAGAPVDPVVGSFSVTFENATDLTDVTASVSVTNLNIPVDSEIGFTYFVAGDVLAIGGLQNGANAVVVGANDFLITLLGASTPSPTVRFDYSVAESSDLGVLETQTVILTPSPPTAVPEPTTLWLLSVGLAATARRLRQRKAL
jgi:hypothetical protein